MTPHIPESVLTLMDFVNDPVPPRDPSDDDEEEDEDEEDEGADNREPAVIREPDEDDGSSPIASSLRWRLCSQCPLYSDVAGFARWISNKLFHARGQNEPRTKHLLIGRFGQWIVRLLGAPRTGMRVLAIPVGRDCHNAIVSDSGGAGGILLPPPAAPQPSSPTQ